MKKIRVFFSSHGNWELSRMAILASVIYHNSPTGLPDAPIVPKNTNQKRRKKRISVTVCWSSSFCPNFFPSFLSALFFGWQSFGAFGYNSFIFFLCHRYTGLSFCLALSCLCSFVWLLCFDRSVVVVVDVVSLGLWGRVHEQADGDRHTHMATINYHKILLWLSFYGLSVCGTYEHLVVASVAKSAAKKSTLAPALNRDKFVRKLRHYGRWILVIAALLACVHVFPLWSNSLL